jgi:hypothetical protein
MLGDRNQRYSPAHVTSVPVFFREGVEPQELMLPFILCQTLHKGHTTSDIAAPMLRRVREE